MKQHQWVVRSQGHVAVEHVVAFCLVSPATSARAAKGLAQDILLGDHNPYWLPVYVQQAQKKQ